MANTNASILIVDGEEFFCQRARQILEKSSYEVLCAYDGKQAKKMISENKLSVVLVNLELPDMNGMNLIAYAKDKDVNICTIVVAAYASLEPAIKALREGVCDYLVKPVDSDALLRAIRNAFSRRKVTIELRSRMKELEEFREIATGRELKMIELKKEIAELRDKIEQLSKKRYLGRNNRQEKRKAPQA